MKQLTVHPPGSWAEVGGPLDTKIKVRILAVSVRESGVTSYEVVWWAGKDRHTAWVEPGELHPVDKEQKPLRIGFSG